ncbi:hypothetical protein [Leifsonia sp. PS1209]|uniref:hypothetical protein n=1 Tax=Leifsonia sp. PS1209 TaxID=2724914 RepID=UPI001442A69D|nr:hypothetical protein [Leifsonia sp. PS1209]QIZ99426.1 hypothetical protein HF024_13505 [Leifsonia sp. PS1209]
MGNGANDEVDAANDGVSASKFASLRRLGAKDFSRFAVEMQHVSEQVQLKLVEQLPEFRKLAADAIASAEKAFEAALKSNDENDRELNAAFKQWRDSLDKVLENPELTLEERLLVTREIGRTVEMQSAKNTESKSFKTRLFQQLVIGAAVAVGIVAVAVVGGKVGLEQGGSNNA